MKQLLVLAMVALGTTVAGAQQLWQDARVGMTPNEVVAAFPGSQAIEPHVSRGRALTKVRLPSVEIAGLKFKTDFAFEDDRLVTVDLAATDLKGAQFDQGKSALLAALRSKYGAEVDRQRSSIGETYTWASGATTIKLMSIAITDGNLYVYYSATVAKDAAKL